MTQYLSVTMDDCKKDEWTYSMQYMGRITRICVPEPLEAMSVTQQECVVTDLLHASFNIVREAKLLKKPEDEVDNFVENVLPKITDDDDYDTDLSDVPTQELMDEINDRINGTDDDDQD